MRRSMSDENQAILQRWIEAWHEGDADAVDVFVTDTYVRHDPNAPEVRGPEAEKQLAAMYLAAFPDLHSTIEDMFAEGDKVVVRYSIRGTHKGELLGIPPTDKQVTLTAIEIHRLVEGKIDEQWVNLDVLGMMQQLGVIPAPEPSEEAPPSRPG